jgi:hypothetical protein
MQMSNLKEIQRRHGFDRWKDAAFIVAAVLMTALALGSVTSQAAGDPPSRQYELTVIESNVELDNR